jgi:hypothetical protein
MYICIYYAPKYTVYHRMSRFIRTTYNKTCTFQISYLFIRLDHIILLAVFGLIFFNLVQP